MKFSLLFLPKFLAFASLKNYEKMDNIRCDAKHCTVVGSGTRTAPLTPSLKSTAGFNFCVKKPYLVAEVYEIAQNSQKLPNSLKIVLFMHKELLRKT